MEIVAMDGCCEEDPLEDCDASERETIRQVEKLYLDMNPQAREYARNMVRAVWETERGWGRLQSQRNPVRLRDGKRL